MCWSVGAKCAGEEAREILKLCFRVGCMCGRRLGLSEVVRGVGVRRMSFVIVEGICCVGGGESESCESEFGGFRREAVSC